MKIGCLGPKGSYSCLAVKELSPEAEVITYVNFPSVVRAILSGEVDEAVLPIENTLQGGVLQNMDLLAIEKDLFAVKEYALPIDHRLVYKSGTKVEDITRVYSHAQAIGQCSVFLSETLKKAKAIPVESTTKGLSMIETATDSAIVGGHLVKDLKGFDVYPEPVADEKVNFTRFFLVKKGRENLLGHSKKIYFMAELPDRPGALYALLGVIERHGLNMNKIESRPIKDRVGEYRFFIEIEGDHASKEIKDVLFVIERECAGFKLIGAY